MRKAKFWNDDGSPRYIRCYEKKRNPTIDRFTVVFGRAYCWGGERYRGRVYYVGSSGNPTHPLGFYQHGEAWAWEFRPCGSRITWASLPEATRRLVLEEYAYIWEGGEEELK
jgi:hypothetical protein